MKSRWESAETFAQYAELEAIDWMLRQESAKTASARPAAAIDQMIDEATGYGVARDLESIDTVTGLVQRKVVLELALGMDATTTEEFLAQLDGLESELKADVRKIKARASLSR